MKFILRQIPITESTNADAKKAAEAGEAEGLVIQALRQTAGKGRQGRNWESPEGNLYVSVLLRPECSPQEAGYYSFVTALAVYDTVSGFLPQADVKIKWPNDVLVNGKKISGILLETGLNTRARHSRENGNPSPVEAIINISETSYPCYLREMDSRFHGNDGVCGNNDESRNQLEWLIIGVGINIQHHPENALYPTTSLSEISGNIEQQVQSVLDSFLQNLENWRGKLLKNGFAPIRSAWLKQTKIGHITAKLPNETVEGEFSDLDNNGNLILRLADGSERSISAGDVFFS